MADSGDTRIVTMFIFGESGLKELPGLFDLIEHHNRTGKWIEITEHIEPRSGTITGIVNMRSEPIANDKTLLAQLKPGNVPPIQIIGKENGYYKCVVYLWEKQVTVNA